METHRSNKRATFLKNQLRILVYLKCSWCIQIPELFRKIKTTVILLIIFWTEKTSCKLEIEFIV